MKTHNVRTFLVKISVESSLKPDAFEGFYSHLHEALARNGVAIEIVATSQNVSFYFSMPAPVAETVKSLIYSIAPAAEISEADWLDTLKLSSQQFTCAELKLSRSSLLPIKDVRDCSSVPFANIMSFMSQCEPDQILLAQILFRPLTDSSWHQFRMGCARKCAAFSHALRPKYWLKSAVKPEAAKRVLEKSSGRLFEAGLSIALAAPRDFPTADQKLESFFSAFSGYNTLDFNQLAVTRITRGPNALARLADRRLRTSFWLTPHELSALFHFPSEQAAPNLQRALCATLAPPFDLPSNPADDEISFFGETNFRSRKIPFGARLEDRRKHFYIVGKSGAGKSKLLELLIRSDIQKGHGVGVLDPHGDLIDNILDSIPAQRVKDVALLDPADLEYPPAFNPLEPVPQELKLRVTIGIVDIFKKLFGVNWSPRLEHVLRYSTLALLDTPGTTLLSLLKLLTDRAFRQSIVSNIGDKVVKDFWSTEFASWSEKFDHEAITPLINKVGQLVATDMLRNMLGQPLNRFNFRELMDHKKIFLMKVSKGLLGEENSSLLGALTVTRIYQAAMSRADTPENRRVDFFLYVDEFQNFATDSFSEILSEARKYRLNLTLANQFVGQLDQRTLKTILGNVANLLAFRVGAEDAKILAEEFKPRVTTRDLINLPVRDFYLKLSQQGEIRETFSGRTLFVAPPKESLRTSCIRHSRQHYALPLKQVRQLLEEDNQKEAGESKSSGQARFAEPII